jgi:hypothetical protein
MESFSGESIIFRQHRSERRLFSTVLGPDSASYDPLFFGPPGSGSGFVIMRNESGSGSVNIQAKRQRKNLIFYSIVTSKQFFTFNFISVKTDVIAPTGSNKQKINKKLFWAIL